MDLCLATFKSFVVQWSAKIAGHWLQLKPLHMLLCLMNHLTKVQKKGKWNYMFASVARKIIVVTCCYNAEFLGIAFAQDLYEKFISYQLEIEPNKLLQVSSNRPNVNLVFLDILNRFRQGIEQPHSVKIGTCGLHTVHNN